MACDSTGRAEPVRRHPAALRPGSPPGTCPAGLAAVGHEPGHPVCRADGRVLYHNPAFLRIWMIGQTDNVVGMLATDAGASTNMLSRPDHFSRHVLSILETREVSDSRGADDRRARGHTAQLPRARRRRRLHRPLDLRRRDPRAPDRRATGVPGRARCPHRALQPTPLPARAATHADRRGPPRWRGRTAVFRPGRIQSHQRQLWPPRGRRAAHSCGQRSGHAGAAQRGADPLRRRRICVAAAQCHPRRCHQAGRAGGACGGCHSVPL